MYFTDYVLQYSMNKVPVGHICLATYVTFPTYSPLAPVPVGLYQCGPRGEV